MSTQLFMLDLPGTDLPSRWSSGNDDAKLNGSSSGWEPYALRAARGNGVNILSASTVTGPTNGVEVVLTGIATHWISPPLDADVTISGSITFNLWAYESNMNANTAIDCVIDKIDGATGAVTQIIKTTRTTELGTSSTVQNWSATPGAGVACKKGDRIRVRVFGDDGTAMASGYTFTFAYDGTSAGVNGDSYVTFTETFGLITTDPTGTTLYPTDTASDIDPGAAIERYLSLARGAGVANDVTNSVAGWTAPIQITDTAGGTVVEWYSKPLNAFTLGGAVLVNGRWSQTSATNLAWRCEIAVVDSDGTNPVVWAVNSRHASIPTSEAAGQFYLSGDDYSVAAGKRLRVRFYIDDPSDAAMSASQTPVFYYAGTSGGASGDTYLILTQTITEVTITTAQLAGALNPASLDLQLTDYPGG
jgi:hypothetical protein